MTLHVAIIGTGGIVRDGHAAAVAAAPSVRLWSVLSRDRNRAVDLARRYNAASLQPAHDRLETLLADPELDAVIIATPDKLHAEQAVAAAEAGKHILLEKPMATDLPGGQAILEACRRNNVTLGLCYHLRWHAGHRIVVTMAHQGEFGEIRHVRALWSWNAKDSSNWRASSALGRWWSLAGVGTHCLDLARWTLTQSGGETVDLSCITSNDVWRGPHDETAVLSARFESGATMNLCSSVLFDSASRFEIYGSKGYAVCDSTFGRKGAGRIWTNKGEINFPIENPFVGLVEDFAAAIKGKRSPAVDGVEGLKNIELLLRAYPS